MFGYFLASRDSSGHQATRSSPATGARTVRMPSNRPDRRLLGVLLGLALLAGTSSARGAGLSEVDRLWTVGAWAFADELYDQAYRLLGRFLRAAPEDPRRGDATVLHGRAALETGHLEEALADFGAAETLPMQSTPSSEPGFWRAETLLRLGRVEEAHEQYGRFLSAAPTSPLAPHALYQRGTAELTLQRSGDAIDSFRTLVNRYPQDPRAGRAAYAAALELVRAKRWDDALPILDSYAARYATSPFLAEAQYLLGVTLIGKQRPDAGTRTLERFLSAQPTHQLSVPTRALLAETYVQSGQTREALGHYQALSKQTSAPELVPDALYQVGSLSSRLGRVREAELAWRRLRRDHPADPQASQAGLALVTLHAKRRQIDQAAEVATEMMEAKAPDRVEALLILGDAARTAGRHGDAERAYGSALADAPESSAERARALEGYLALADASARASRGRESERLYRLVVEQAPPGSREHARAVADSLRLADGYLQAGKASEAERLYTAMLAEAPAPAAGRLLGLGSGALKAGKAAEAERLYAAVLASVPAESAEAGAAIEGLLRVGEGALKSSRIDDADRAYAHAAQAASVGSAHRFDALAGLGVVAEIRGDLQRARLVYQQVVNGSQDPVLVRWATTKLERLAPQDAAPGAESPAAPE